MSFLHQLRHEHGFDIYRLQSISHAIRSILILLHTYYSHAHNSRSNCAIIYRFGLMELVWNMRVWLRVDLLVTGYLHLCRVSASRALST